VPTSPPVDRPRRLAYLGTPDMAVPPLRALHEAGFEIPLVVSRADTRRGRGGAAAPSPVKAAALELGIPVTDEVDDLLPLAAAGDVELGVVVAYGRIIRPHVLDALAMVNVHFSLLPRWRGAAPVERAILAGDEVTGVSIMDVAEGLDTGDVYRWGELRIGAEETAAELRERLVHMGTALLVETLLDGVVEPMPQEGEPVYAEKIHPEELQIDWSRPAVWIHRQVRVGGAWTTFRGRRLKVWGVRPADAPPGGLAASLDGCVVRCGEGALELVEVQPEGKGRIAAEAWRNGARPTAGELLGS
jgi:methionyl-tRNA formyltransferase